MYIHYIIHGKKKSGITQPLSTYAKIHVQYDSKSGKKDGDGEKERALKGFGLVYLPLSTPKKCSFHMRYSTALYSYCRLL